MAEAGDLTPERATLDTSVAHPARVYDYWLGGKDNFAADREAAEQVIAAKTIFVLMHSTHSLDLRLYRQISQA
jgi:hypothetical protein